MARGQHGARRRSECVLRVRAAWPVPRSADPASRCVAQVDFFNEINLLYGVVAEFCTESSCPVMCAGPKYEYMWADGTQIRKPIHVSAPKYVDYLMTWVQHQLDDERLFPTQIGVPFPSDFLEAVRNIFRRLFRIYAHIYYCHFDKMSELGAEPHLNTCARERSPAREIPRPPRPSRFAAATAPQRHRPDAPPFPVGSAARPHPPAPARSCFKHYMYFVYEFDLIPRKEELAPLQELIDKLMERDTQLFAAGAAAEGGAAAS